MIELLPFSSALLDRRGRVVAANEVLAGAVARARGELPGLAFVGELVEVPPELADEVRTSLEAGTIDLRFDGALRGGGDGTRSCRVVMKSLSDGEVLALVDAEDRSRGDSPPPELREVYRQISATRHALNNVLMGLMGHAELLLEIPDLPERARIRAEAIMRETRRLREAVEEMSKIYRKPPDDSES